MTDWILLAQGVNIDATVLNTNDLSTIRGSSLTLEAIAKELQDHPKLDQADLIIYGGSHAAFLVKDLSARDAQQLRDDVDLSLRGGRHGADEPRNMATPEVAGGLQPGETAKINPVPPTKHMRIMVDVQPIESLPSDADAAARGRVQEEAFRVAMVRNRRRQLRSPNIPKPGSATAPSASLGSRAAMICPVDPAQMLPEDVGDNRWNASGVVSEASFPRAQTLPDPSLKGPQKRVCFSQRTADLRTYGRDARQRLYEFQLCYTDERTDTRGSDLIRGFQDRGLFGRLDFPASNDQISLIDPKSECGSLPAPLWQKLCYLTFDGTGFGALRSKIGNTQTFSRMIRRANAHALELLLDRFVTGATADDGTACRWTSKGGLYRKQARQEGWETDLSLLRLETLMFGGEDIAIVTAPWLAFDVAKLMLRALHEGAREALKGTGYDAPTWRVGMLICDGRTPARRASKIAYNLCEDAKPTRDGDAYGKTPGGLSLHISESYDLPEPEARNVIDLLRARFQELGASGDALANAFRFAGNGIDEFVHGVTMIKANLPRSQVYRLLQSEPEGFDLAGALADISRRSRRAFDPDKVLAWLPSPDAPRRLRLALLAEVWDYIDPFNVGPEAGA